MEIRFLSSRCLWLAATALLIAPACDSESASSGSAVDPQPAPQIKMLSNRADMISGGDALVEIVLAEGVKADGLHVALGTKDITSAFAKGANGRIIGLVTGLAEGPNILAADLGTGHGSYMMITNHKIGGPVFSGPQVTPFVCATPTATSGTGDTPSTNPSGLTTMATDAQCNIATEIKLYYRTTTAGCSTALPDPDPPVAPPASPCFKPYTSGTPADLAMTTTDAGVTVPYIVRVERGTLNRGIYDIAVLFDPAKDDPKTGWKPTAPQKAWNGKVVYTFGASSGQPRLQFRSEQSWTDDLALSRGFLVALNSMTDSKYNANRVTMSETVMMMKEKIIDNYGEVRYVIGNGCSGGSINQLTTASIFPGLLDGIQPTCTYPDSETTGIEVADCTLLVNFYNSPAWQALQSGVTQAAINAKKTAINGHVDQTGCHAWVNLFSNLGKPGNYVPINVIDDTTGATGPVGSLQNNCGLPASMVYDAASNPNGVRCTGADHSVAILGTVKDTKRAGTTADNVGVQYGLAAFLSRAISADEFVALNESIGGVDFDSNFVAARSTADPAALAAVYRAGIVSDGHHLAQTAIMDLRGYDDTKLAAPFGIHHVWRSFALRARLDTANGNHANHVMWRYGDSPFLVAPPTSNMTAQAFVMMDQWLGAMKLDTKSTSLVARIAANRPAAAFDFCYLSTDTLFSSKVTDPAVCDSDRFLKPHASPRQVAGGPLAENILKCQLRPINRADYNPVGLTDVQFQKLSAAFPDGVCDFTKPGVGQQDAVGPLDFSAGPGGVPFAPEPLTKAF
jgi:hypothetical protein